MLWKNNNVEHFSDRRERFSIRKLSIGAASVMIGAFFMGVQTNQVVHADTVEATEAVKNDTSTKSDTSEVLDKKAEFKNTDTSVKQGVSSKDTAGTTVDQKLQESDALQGNQTVTGKQDAEKQNGGDKR